MTTPGLTVPVAAPGLSETSQGFEKLGQSATQATGGMQKAAGAADNFSRSATKAAASTRGAGDAFAGLATKVRSGEVLRNGAASFALMATAGDGALEKIAALGGAFAMIPGPIGIASAAIAVGATVLNVFAKSAEEAEKQAQALRDSLVDLGKQKIAAQVAVAARLGAAAAKVGPDLLGNIARGGGGEARQVKLFGGDVNASLQYGSKLAQSGLDEAGKAKVDAALNDQRNAGERITSEMQDRAIEVIKAAAENVNTNPDDVAQAMRAREEAQQRGGGIFGDRIMPVEQQGAVGSRANNFIDIQGGDAESGNRRFNNSNSGYAKGVQSALDQVNAPAIAEAVRTLSDATNITGANSEALSVATEQNTKSTIMLTKAITDLEIRISNTQSAIDGKGPARQVDTGGNFGGGWWGSRNKTASSQ
jgi:hypothetical protein